jgi:tRNA pseudouridine32 synthase / 23S rRNA pseudouridine746 synthase
VKWNVFDNSYVLYEDALFLIADKPSGLLSVPGKGPEKQDCLLSRLERDYESVYTVHRLDQGTSGLMVYARDGETRRFLGRQFEEKKVQKEYEALLLGILPSEKGRSEYRQRLDPDNRPWQIIDEERGKLGITGWDVRDVFRRGGREITRVRFFPRTGRTHQLRLHSRELGAPIAGDPLYGEGTTGEYPRLMLHSAYLEFPHPRDGRSISFRLSVPF